MSLRERRAAHPEGRFNGRHFLDLCFRELLEEAEGVAQRSLLAGIFIAYAYVEAFTGTREGHIHPPDIVCTKAVGGVDNYYIAVSYTHLTLPTT